MRVYLVPDGYVGPAIVAFDRPTGRPAERRGDTLVYRIPPSGLLLTSDSYRSRRRSVQYAYEDKRGHFIPIPNRLVQNGVPASDVQVVRSVGSSLDPLVAVYGDTLLYCEAKPSWAVATSVQFAVGTLKDYERLWAELDSLVEVSTAEVAVAQRPGCLPTPEKPDWIP